MGHRGYNPRTGRFLSRDPIGYEGGINLYAYAGNNPVTHADPSGLQSGSGLNFAEEAIQWTFTHPNEISPAAMASVAAVTSGTASTSLFVEALTGTAATVGATISAPFVVTIGAASAGLIGVYNLSQEYLANISNSVEEEEASQGRKQKRVVLGETMKDIFPSAKFYEADYYHAWKQEEFNFDLAMKRNRAWIRRKIKEGFTFFDIGLDSRRKTRSPFYAMELEELKRAGIYGNTRHYRKVRIRK